MTPDHELTPDKDDAGFCVESRRRPDSLRVSRASWLPPGTSPEVAQDTWPLLNLSSADKRGIVLEIDREDGYQALTQIIAAADVFVTNLSADVIPRLRVGYDDIRAIEPDAIYLAMTAFGFEGPYRSFRTWGMNLCAVSGLDAMVGWPDRDRTGIGMSFPDYPSALMAVTAIVAALQRRRRTGDGARLELPQYCIGPTVVEAYGKRRRSPPMGQYQARDGAIMIVAYTPWQWRALAEWISAEVGTREVVSERYGGTPGDRSPYVDELDGWIEDLTTRYGKQELAEEAQRRGIPVCPVNSVTDLLADPHLAATDSWISVPSPQGSVRMPAAALSVDGLALPVGPIPSAGADNAEILTAELSLSEPELLRLRQAGVV